MPVRSSSSEISVEIAPADLSRLLKDARQFSPELAKATRRRLREAGQAGVQDVQRRLRTGTSHSNTGLRAGLAAGTKVSIRGGARTAGISIVTTGAKLAAAKQAMVRAYNKASFRHHVFGHNVWVSQRGRPYFGAVLDGRKADMQRAMQQALTDAADTIRAGEVTA